MNQPTLPLPLLTWRDFTPAAPNESDDWAHTIRGWGYEENAEFAAANYLHYPKHPGDNIHLSVYQITIDAAGNRHGMALANQWCATVAEAKADAETILKAYKDNQ